MPSTRRKPSRVTKPVAKRQSKRKAAFRRPLQLVDPDEPALKFLEWPAEIRNNLYEMIARETNRVMIRPSGKAYITARHPLLQLCNQVHREFSGTLTRVAPVTAEYVIAEVVDLNFYNVITFLNRVAADPGSRVEDFHDLDRLLTIDLTFTDAFASNPPVENLAKWMKCASKWRPRDPRFSVVFAYRIKEISDAKRVREVMESLKDNFNMGQSYGEILEGVRAWKGEEKPKKVVKAGEDRERMKVLVKKMQDLRMARLQRKEDEHYQAIYKAMDAQHGATYGGHYGGLTGGQGGGAAK